VSFKLGRYHLLAPLPSGSSGSSSYLCRQAGQWGFERLFIVKTIPVDSAEATASLMREARIGGLLNHSNVGRVIDVGSASGRPFLVLDYVEGTSLAVLLSGSRPAPAAVVVSILLDALQGLQAVHDMVDGTGEPLGIVHCDLSPDSIVVGVDGIARINDFGKARLAGEPADDQRPPTAGLPSPEQLRNDPVDRRTDVFAMGVTLWTALTGRTLSIDLTGGQTILDVLHTDIEPPSVHGAPAALDEVCRKALDRSPAGRYQSADEMRLALHRVAASEGLLASSAEIGSSVIRIAGQELADRRRLLGESPRDDRPAAPPSPVVVPPPIKIAPRRRPWVALAVVALLAAAGVLAAHETGNAATPGTRARISALFGSAP
jgi:eukaryotic-like serine/threonine-protein kinase